MTRLRTIAEAIKTRLEEVPGLSGKVVVLRRATIDTEFDKRMNKVKGRAVIVRLLGARNIGKAKSSFYVGTFTVSLFTVPLLTQKDVEDVDDLMTAIEGKLQGWWPENVPSNSVMWMNCDGITYPDDRAYDVSVLTVNAPGNLK